MSEQTPPLAQTKVHIGEVVIEPNGEISLIDEETVVPIGYRIVPRLVMTRYMVAWKGLLPDSVSGVYRGPFVNPTELSLQSFETAIAEASAQQYQTDLYFLTFGQERG
jgi:hypothetical protein